MGNTSLSVSRRVTAFLSVMAIAGIMYVLAATVAMHLLRPDLPVLSSPISQYAIGRYGELFTLALLVWGISSLILAIELYRSVLPSIRSRIGIFLLVVFGTGLIIASKFPMDAHFPPRNFRPESFTATGLTHICSATIASVCFPFAALCLSNGFKKEGRCRSFQPLARILAFSTLAALAGFFIIFVVIIRLFGIGQRVLAALVLLWMLLTAIRLFYDRKFPHSA